MYTYINLFVLGSKCGEELPHAVCGAATISARDEKKNPPIYFFATCNEKNKMV